MATDKTTLELKIALGWYTDATAVQSFGYEELRDNGNVARKALGFGEHAADCAWPNGYGVPSIYNPETGEYDEAGPWTSGEKCTCGLQDEIDQVIAGWLVELVP